MSVDTVAARKNPRAQDEAKAHDAAKPKTNAPMSSYANTQPKVRDGLQNVLQSVVAAYSKVGDANTPRPGDRGTISVTSAAPTEDGPATPKPGGEPYKIKDVKQTELSVFFSQYEDSSSIEGKDFTEKFLTNPQMMEYQNNLVQNLVDRVENGEKPLTREEFYDLALEETGDPGTALMAAHNVTKALSRGRSPIEWSKNEDSPDGTVSYTFNGKEITFPDDDNDGSVFYDMFDKDSVGEDPGDAYHFYLNATATYYGGSGQLEFNDPGFFRNPADVAHILDGTVDDTMSQMQELDRASGTLGEDVSDARMAWTYANSLSYLEGAKYGSGDDAGQQEVNRESDIHREGAAFGLELAGTKPASNWNWYVPQGGSASGDLDTTVDISDEYYHTLESDGTVTYTNPKLAEGGEGGERRLRRRPRR